jgi:UDP-glucose 4-epimerase
MKVVVTGAAGYIGGQTLLQLTDAGHDVLAIDRVPPPGHLMIVPCSWHTGDFVSPLGLDAIKLFCPDAIVHCAGTSLVGPSMVTPEDYYYNNFVKTKTLLDFLVRNHYKKVRFVFSSSAAAYGNPIMTPCQEVDPTEPISPYGQSKLMIEWMLESYHRAYGLDYVAFRYFNACGADSQARHGQAPGATHIIARVLESIKNNTDFVCYGQDYETPDGTCIRDYVHVEDIARAHTYSLGVDKLQGIYNLGSSQGYSNLDIIRVAEEVSVKKVKLGLGPRREGDPAVLTADSKKFFNETEWEPTFNLHDIISHAWTWYNR